MVSTGSTTDGCGVVSAGSTTDGLRCDLDKLDHRSRVARHDPPGGAHDAKARGTRTETGFDRVDEPWEDGPSRRGVFPAVVSSIRPGPTSGPGAIGSESERKRPPESTGPASTCPGAAGQSGGEISR